MSPPRSPTPPGTLPIEERHVESSYWDVRPPQFAGIGAMEAKMTGRSAVPGVLNDRLMFFQACSHMAQDAFLRLYI